MREVLTVRGLRSGYDGSTVLHGVDLAIREGQVVALLGRNGVGKTTLISTIAGLLRPYAGEVVYEGTDYAGARPDVVARAGVALPLVAFVVAFVLLYVAPLVLSLGDSSGSG